VLLILLLGLLTLLEAFYLISCNNWPLEAMGGGKDQMSEDGTRQTCQWPPEIKNLQDSFKTFYLKNKNGRKLDWLGFAGNADLKCTFPKIPGKEGALSRERRYDIQFPTYGMVVLLLFNDLAEGEYLSFEEIQERTSIPVGDLSRILHTLAVVPKARVLSKQPANKDTPKAGDKFCFNSHFSSKALKIKAPVIAGNKVEGLEERKETEEKNQEHRGPVIDTTIVRIMKSVSHAPPDWTVRFYYVTRNDILGSIMGLFTLLS